jgi:hypothetical protein
MVLNKNRWASLCSMLLVAAGAGCGPPPEDGEATDLTDGQSVRAPLEAADEEEESLTATSGEGLGAEAVVITCKLKVNDPHNSHHVPGVVNTTAKIQCSSAVSELSIDLTLLRNNRPAAGGFNSSVGKAFVTANANAPCITDLWSARGTGKVFFPPGFNPPTGTMSARSPHQPLILCNR